MAEPPGATDLLMLTAQIVAAHASRNPIAPDALPALIASVYGALSSIGKEPAHADPLRPAVPIKKSIQQDYLVCLEDGAKVTMLKRYLGKRFNLTPSQYRERWGLPADYPMVAPSYAERRSVLAKESGLGRKTAPKPAVASSKPGRSNNRRGKDTASDADDA